MLQALQRMGPVLGAARTDVVEFNIGLWHHKKEGEYGGFVQVWGPGRSRAPSPVGKRQSAARRTDAAACLRARLRPGAPVRGWEPAGARLAGSERPPPALHGARKQALADNYAANRSAGPALVWRDNSPQHFDIENGARGGGGGGAGAGLPRGVAGRARPRPPCSAGARDPFDPPQPHPHPRSRRRRVPAPRRGAEADLGRGQGRALRAHAGGQSGGQGGRRARAGAGAGAACGPAFRRRRPPPATSRSKWSSHCLPCLERCAGPALLLWVSSQLARLPGPLCPPATAGRGAAAGRHHHRRQRARGARRLAQHHGAWVGWWRAGAGLGRGSRQLGAPLGSQLAGRGLADSSRRPAPPMLQPTLSPDASDRSHHGRRRHPHPPHLEQHGAGPAPRRARIGGRLRWLPAAGGGRGGAPLHVLAAGAVREGSRQGGRLLPALPGTSRAHPRRPALCRSPAAGDDAQRAHGGRVHALVQPRRLLSLGVEPVAHAAGARPVRSATHSRIVPSLHVTQLVCFRSCCQTEPVCLLTFPLHL